MFEQAPAPRAVLAHAAIAATEAAARRHKGPFGAYPDFRVNLVAPRLIDLYEGDTRHMLGVTHEGDGHRVEGEGAPMFARLRCASAAEHRIVGEIDGAPTSAVVLVRPGRVEVRIEGSVHAFTLQPPRAAALAAASDGRIAAPMPGRVLQIAVRPGQKVGAGERLIVLEAMKMEHRITAPGSAIVRALHVSEADQVSEGALLIELDPDPTE